MRLPRIDETLESCERHLDSTGTFNTAIDTLLAYGVLIRVYAEFEQFIESVIEEKSASIENLELRASFNDIVESNYRGIRYSRLAELFGSFGGTYRAEFNNKRLDNPQAVTSYGNIMTQRRDVAHRTEPEVTFRDVRNYYEQGHVVLDFFRETLLAIDPAQPTS